MWGAVGSHHAQLRNFAFGSRAFWRYARGHNPQGSLSVLAALLILPSGGVPAWWVSTLGSVFGY